MRTQIKTMVDEALVQFGVDHYRDQDPHEVMDVTRIVRTLRSMTAEDAKTMLLDVLDLETSGASGRNLRILVASILGDLRAQPDDWFRALMENDRLAGHL